MNSVYDFIITPKEGRYNNEKKVGDKTLVLNTSIEDHKLVSKQAIIVAVPLAFKTILKVGDEVMPWKKFNSNMAISVEYDLEY